MVQSAGRWGSSGQATLEHIGVTLVIALLLGVVGTWAVREVRPPTSPPDILTHVMAPLTALAQASDARGVFRGASPARPMERRGGEVGLTRRVWGGFLWWGELNVDGQIAAGRGFLEQIGIRAEDIVKDSVTTITGAAGRLSKPPVTGSANRVASIVGQLMTIGDRPFRKSFLGISRDLGGLAADWLIAKFARGVGGKLSGVFGG